MRSTPLVAAIAFAIALPACVTSAVTTDTDPAWPHARAQFDGRVHADADLAAPVERVALAPALPSVEHVRGRVRYEAGAEPSASLRVCVAAAGGVTSVALERGSMSAVFDDAVLADVRAWRYAPLPGPATAQTCQRATIVYRAP
jgi:TonB family protein